MSDFREELGFIPPELLYKCDGIVRAFHDARGSSKDFVAASALSSAGSTNLTAMVRNVVAILNLIKLLSCLISHRFYNLDTHKDMVTASCDSTNGRGRALFIADD